MNIEQSPAVSDLTIGNIADAKAVDPTSAALNNTPSSSAVFASFVDRFRSAPGSGRATVDVAELLKVIKTTPALMRSTIATLVSASPAMAQAVDELKDPSTMDRIKALGPELTLASLAGMIVLGEIARRCFRDGLGRDRMWGAFATGGAIALGIGALLISRDSDAQYLANRSNSSPLIARTQLEALNDHYSRLFYLCAEMVPGTERTNPTALLENGKVVFREIKVHDLGALLVEAHLSAAKELSPSDRDELFLGAKAVSYAKMLRIRDDNAPHYMAYDLEELNGLKLRPPVPVSTIDIENYLSPNNSVIKAPQCLVRIADTVALCQRLYFQAPYPEEGMTNVDAEPKSAPVLAYLAAKLSNNAGSLNQSTKAELDAFKDSLPQSSKDQLDAYIAWFQNSSDLGEYASRRTLSLCKQNGVNPQLCKLVPEGFIRYFLEQKIDPSAALLSMALHNERPGAYFASLVRGFARQGMSASFAPQSEAAKRALMALELAVERYLPADGSAPLMYTEAGLATEDDRAKL